MVDLLELADGLWNGTADPGEHHPFMAYGQLVDVAPDTGFVSGFANTAAFRTPDGLVLVDTGSFLTAGITHSVLRGWTPQLLHSAVFTHGHVDHCFGVERYEEENAAARAAPPRVVAHELVPARFDRYRRSAGYNQVINRRQFGAGDIDWPTAFREPDEIYRQDLTLVIGDEPFELHHARGETDDHTWVWAPARRVLCTGDLFIWASPNCGNPQKVQRYAREWAAALRTMAELPADVLLPGHGLPVVGPDRVRRALTDTAALLESLHDQTLAFMNTGATLDEVLQQVRAPAELLARPYLRPVYDEPEFVVHGIWRAYGGWYDGNPARLKPAPDAALAAEVAALAGGVDALVRRARELADSGELRLAGHLAEWAWRAEPGDPACRDVRAHVNELRAHDATSTMAKGIFRAAATEARTPRDG